VSAEKQDGNSKVEMREDGKGISRGAVDKTQSTAGQMMRAGREARCF